MAFVNLGRVKQVWKGVYNNATAYKIDDTLYCLDPWGKDMKNISLSIFYQLQKIL